jgi:hypothetical protein
MLADKESGKAVEFTAAESKTLADQPTQADALGTKQTAIINKANELLAGTGWTASVAATDGHALAVTASTVKATGSANVTLTLTPQSGEPTTKALTWTIDKESQDENAAKEAIGKLASTEKADEAVSLAADFTSASEAWDASAISAEQVKIIEKAQELVNDDEWMVDVATAEGSELTITPANLANKGKATITLKIEAVPTDEPQAKEAEAEKTVTLTWNWAELELNETSIATSVNAALAEESFLKTLYNDTESSVITEQAKAYLSNDCTNVAFGEEGEAFTPAKATENTTGSITGTLIVTYNDGSEKTTKVSINLTIPKLQSLAEAKTAVEAAIADLEVSASTTGQNILDAANAAVDSKRYSVTETGSITNNNAGSITGTLTIGYKNTEENGTSTETVEVNKTYVVVG